MTREHVGGAAVGEELAAAEFVVGGSDQLQKLRDRYQGELDQEQERTLRQEWDEELRKLQVRIGTLLKTDTVSFLFGAGVSKDCGGVLFGSVPKEIEGRLLDEGVLQGQPPRVCDWLLHFYRAVQESSQGEASAPLTPDAVAQRRVDLGNAEPLHANYEQVVSQLYRWRNALGCSQSGSLNVTTEHVSFEANVDDLQKAIHKATDTLAVSVRLPVEGKESELHSFRMFCRKVLARPLNLRRASVFTLNYDTLLEQAADAEGVVLVDGFSGTLRRVFRPETYDQDLYFPAQTTEGRVHRYDRVLHLYKLHGSLSWSAEAPGLGNPYGVAVWQEPKPQCPLIYPTPSKYGEVLGMPYAELFRRFAATVVRPQSTLFAVGYGFGDEHVNAIIHQALAVPSFTLVVVDPSAGSEFVQRLRELKDSRVWILSGMTLGTFAGFVHRALPDLKEDEIQTKVHETWRALGVAKSSGEVAPEDDPDA